MAESVGKNLILKHELVSSTLIFFIFFSAFSYQNIFHLNYAKALEGRLKSPDNLSIMFDKEKHKEIEKEKENKIDIVQESQKWETSIRQRYKYGQIKTIDEGLKHIALTKQINGRPVKINIVEINQTLNPNINLTPALANTNTLASKSPISKIAKENNSVIAINGGFFKPQNGIPLGSLMIDGKLLTGPMYNRAALGIFDNDFKIDRVELNANVTGDKYNLKIDNINQPRMLSTYVLAYTTDWGKMAPPSPKYGMQVAIKDNKIIDYSINSLMIPDGGYVIVGPKDKLISLTHEKKVKVELNTNPDWENVRHIISGGPYLIKNNEIFIDVTSEKLGSITGRNPRTAVGITKDNNLVLITIDGREQNSIGMTLNELATFMKSIGCIQALNLDGGGSSIMYINGSIVNSPSIKGGIALSNALTVSINNEKISSIENE